MIGRWEKGLKMKQGSKEEDTGMYVPVLLLTQDNHLRTDPEKGGTVY